VGVVAKVQGGSRCAVRVSSITFRLRVCPSRLALPPLAAHTMHLCRGQSGRRGRRRAAASGNGTKSRLARRRRALRLRHRLGRPCLGPRRHASRLARCAPARAFEAAAGRLRSTARPRTAPAAAREGSTTTRAQRSPQQRRANARKRAPGEWCAAGDAEARGGDAACERVMCTGHVHAARRGGVASACGASRVGRARGNSSRRSGAKTSGRFTAPRSRLRSRSTVARRPTGIV